MKWDRRDQMNVIELDFGGIKSLWELHEYLKEAFGLPDYYGHNMDALWDCLHCSFDEPTTIILNNLSGISKELKEAAETMLEVFADLEREDEEVTVQIKTANDTHCNLSDFMI